MNGTRPSAGSSLADSFNVHIGHMETGYYSGSVHRSPGGHGLIRADANPDADPDHLFYRQVIVFTGALMSRTRQMEGEGVHRTRSVTA